MNLYAYTGNDPVNFVDPTGLTPDGSQGYTITLSEKVPSWLGLGSFTVSASVTIQSQVQQLTNAQNAAMSDPSLQPGAHGAASHCSEATCQIARAMGVNTAPLGPSKGGFYRANGQVANLAQAAQTPGSGWHATDLASAQQLANQGQLVIIGWINLSGGPGHTVTVMSDPNNPHAATNPTVAQVGGSTGNGSMSFRKAFGADKRGQVQVYVYTGH